MTEEGPSSSYLPPTPTLTSAGANHGISGQMGKEGISASESSLPLCLGGHWTTHSAGRIPLNPRKSRKWAYCSAHFPDQETEAQRDITARVTDLNSDQCGFDPFPCQPACMYHLSLLGWTEGRLAPICPAPVWP